MEAGASKNGGEAANFCELIKIIYMIWHSVLLGDGQIVKISYDF